MSRPRRGARSPIAASVRYEVLRRSGFRCSYCGIGAPDAFLQIDHIVPVARGGTNDPANLTAACQRCNIGKGVGSAEPGGVKFEIAPVYTPPRGRGPAIADFQFEWEDDLDLPQLLGEPEPLL